MRLIKAVLVLLPNVAFRRATSRVLESNLSPDAARDIWARTKALHADLRGTRPRASPGLDLLLRYLEWDVALYRALREAGETDDVAGRLIDEVNWNVLGPSTSLGFSLSRLRSARPRTRVQWTVDMMFALLFTSPFQRIKHASDDDVAFDVTVCPFAQYFASQGVPELTRYAVCGLDHKMARDWGVSLKREHTIAEGHSACDFRFQIERPRSHKPAPD